VIPGGGELGGEVTVEAGGLGGTVEVVEPSPLDDSVITVRSLSALTLSELTILGLEELFLMPVDPLAL